MRGTRVAGGSALLALTSLGLLACSDPPPPPPEPAPQESPAPLQGWRDTLLFNAGFEVTALAAGELHRAPGLELVLLGAQGQVLVARREGAGWKREQVQTGPGALRAALVGDFDPSAEGLELAVCGETEDGRGRVLLLTRTSQGIWRPDLAWGAARPLFALGSYEGQLFVSGASLTRLARRGRDWEAIAIGGLPSPGRALLAFRDQLLIGCANGEIATALSVARPDEDRSPFGERSAGALGLASAEQSLICADAEGALARREGRGPWVEVYRSPRALRAALAVDLDPQRAGPELFTCGDAGEVVVVGAEADGELRPQILRREGSPWRGLVQLDASALVAASEGGAVVELRYYP